MKLYDSVVLTVLIALSMGVAYFQRTISEQENSIDSGAWFRTLSAAGLNHASPSQIVPYLRQHGLTHITVRGAWVSSPMPGYCVVTACIAPSVVVVGPVHLPWGKPHALSLFFCNGKLYGEGVGAWE